jgi:two-component system, chemotaxis family, protein-glutamate methylesterase/glutaminase
LTECIRVLVVDDSAFMRKALSREIGSDPRFEVVGVACDGREAVQMALNLQPDVITLDVEMPVLSGLESLQELSARSSAAVIMLSSATEAGAKTTLEALALGAIDFIPKNQCTSLLPEKLLAAASVRAQRMKSAARQIVQNGHGDGVPTHCHALPKTFSPKAIVIGSSTGGPQALAELFSNLAPALPAPVFIAQHMPRPFTEALARRLRDLSGHCAVEAKDGDVIASGTVYVAPGGLQMRTKDGRISVKQDAGGSVYQPSVDVLTASVFETYGASVLAIMLTGLGRDGAREFTRLKNAGGWTIAQDGQSCTVFGMPKSVIDAGGACEVMPLKAIAPRVSDILYRRDDDRH